MAIYEHFSKHDNDPENYEYDEIDYLLSYKEKNGLIFVDYEKALRKEELESLKMD